MGVETVGYIPYKQFGYRQGTNYDKSYVIEEQTWTYQVTLEIVYKRGGRQAGSRVIIKEFNTLVQAQQYLEKKVY